MSRPADETLNALFVFSGMPGVRYGVKVLCFGVFSHFLTLLFDVNQPSLGYIIWVGSRNV